MNNNINRIDEIIENFIKKNGNESRYTKDIKNKLLKWINNTDNIDIKNILLELFSEFKLFNKLEIKQIMEEQLIKCLEEVNIDYTNICHFPSLDGRFNSSNEMIPLIREIDREGRLNIPLYSDSIVTGIEKISDDIEYVIFFDDISGTGGTIIKFLNKNLKFLSKRKIYINLIAITKEAELKIDEFKKNNILDVKINYKYKFDKVFKELDRFDDTHECKLYEFEKSIWGNRETFVLGYNNSQILVGFEHNIPNNTISSFWVTDCILEHREKWNALFERYTPNKRPKKSRKVQNRNNRIRSGK